MEISSWKSAGEPCSEVRGEYGDWQNIGVRVPVEAMSRACKASQGEGKGQCHGNSKIYEWVEEGTVKETGRNRKERSGTEWGPEADAGRLPRRELLPARSHRAPVRTGLECAHRMRNLPSPLPESTKLSGGTQVPSLRTASLAWSGARGGRGRLPATGHSPGLRCAGAWEVLQGTWFNNTCVWKSAPPLR